MLARDLGAGEEFTEAVAEWVIARLSAGGPCEHEDFLTPGVARVLTEGWRHRDGTPLSERGLSAAVIDVLLRGEAYGVIAGLPGDTGSQSRRRDIVLSEGGALALGLHPVGAAGMPALGFGAELLNAPGIGAHLAVAAHQHLSAVHDAIWEAFGWQDDHLYSFWLDGSFWGEEAAQLARPGIPDTTSRTADVSLAELALRPGALIAYVFDYGDEWRVRLTLAEQTVTDDGAYPRVLERRGSPPQQYPTLDDE